MEQKTVERYNEWKRAKLSDADLVRDLESVEGCEDEINDRFYKELEFGTAGLRGILGAGTNRMNIYTVGRATKGYAEYLKAHSDKPSMAIAYDSRHKSDVFARMTAAIMASRGVHVYIWKELMPTPSLSYAVRYFNCDGGVVVTASHNPSQYNGYKAYDNTGCQIDEAAADEVTANILKEPMFDDNTYDFEHYLKEGSIEYIDDSVRDRFVAAAAAWDLIGDTVDKSCKIAYTPLYGTGLKCVTQCLKENGFTNIVLVKEQAEPNGDFPTAPYPNPEIRQAMEVGLRVAKEENADILIATDPDADRIGIAVKDGDDYRLISGNETGMLLLDWICKMRVKNGSMPKDPLCVKSIVSTDMIYHIAREYNVEVIDVLTGFKNIAPVVTELAKKNEESRYIFGYEESYGYMLGTHVRDKDAVSAAYLIAQMFAYYHQERKSLLQVLDEIYAKFGYYLNVTESYVFPGEDGFKKMNSIMEEFRNKDIKSFAGIPVVERQDYIHGLNGMQPSNVLKYVLKDYSMVVLRPSGTEPKLKLYVGVSAKTKDEAQKIVEAIINEVDIKSRQ